MVIGLVADLDHSIVRSLNRWFAGLSSRVDLAKAGGLMAGILPARRWVLGSGAVVATIALAIGRIGAGLHYPSDCAAAVAAAVVGMAILLPFRPLLRPPLRFVARVERRIFRR